MLSHLRRLKAWRRSRAERRDTRYAIDRLPLEGVDEKAWSRAMFRDLLMDRRADRRSRTGRAVLYFGMFGAPALIYFGVIAWQSGFRYSGSAPMVALIRLQGEMSQGSNASGDKVVPVIRKACADDRAAGIVFAIDSPGGAPLEAERIYTAMEMCRREHHKPMIAIINNLGASAAYMVALHADKIYAGKYSLVGSVGAILSGWDAHEALGRVGLSQRVYASGELKSMMNPYVPMSAAAERKAQDLVEQMGMAFRSELQAQRGKKLLAGVEYGSGGVWNGEDAKRIGLVDEISTVDDVIAKQWPKHKVRDFGPGNLGFPFASAAAGWMREVITKTFEPTLR
jgi:protease-4